MGESPKTVEEVIKRALYNYYLYEMMRRLELRGIVLHQTKDFEWVVYGSHYDTFAADLLKEIEDFRASEEV